MAEGKRGELPRYPKYKDSGVEWLGEVPAGWEILANKAFLRHRQSLVGADWSTTQLLSLSLRGVVPRDIDSGEGKYPADFGGYQHVAPNDLVFCLFDMDETPRTVGLSTMNGMITSAYDVFRCLADAVPAYVVYYYLHLDAFKGLRPYYTGLRKVIRPPTFMAIKIPLPPVDEQHAIATFLDQETAKIDALIAEQERLIELLTEKRQAVISHAVTKGLNPDAPMKDSGIEWLGRVPAGWAVSRLRSVVRRIESGTSVNAADEPAQLGELGVLKTSCVYTGRFDYRENKKVIETDASRVSCPLRAGTLVVSRMNTPELVGAAGLVHIAPENIFLPDRLWQVSFAGLNPAFAYWWTQTPAYRRQVECACAGTSSSMQNIAQDQFKAFSLAIPTNSEQHDISTFLDQETAKIDALIAHAQRAIPLLKERRTALISAAVTGKIDVRGLVPAQTIHYEEGVSAQP